jgi:hypothetical protein
MCNCSNCVIYCGVQFDLCLISNFSCCEYTALMRYDYAIGISLFRFINSDMNLRGRVFSY